jgi:hypothetical protein
VGCAVRTGPADPPGLARDPIAEINTLPRRVGLLIVRCIRTTREQKEANTVHTNRVKANLPEPQRQHAQRATTRIASDYPWSLPSRVIMSFCLGISYALGAGQVPV